MSDNMKRMFDRIIRNKIRMGNFETTDRDMDCVRKLLQFPDRPFSAADFCAGSGRAMEILTQGSKAVTFGVEPNEEKYLELRERVHQACFGGYEQCRISKDYFRLIYLNPPYDDDSESEESKRERKEKVFLRHIIQYLAVDGILIYNIPRRRMTKDIVNLLVTNLDEINVYQSHDDTYGQVYVFGRKRSVKFIDRPEVQRILGLVAEGIVLSRLPEAIDPIYKVPAGNVTPKYFRSIIMDVDQLRVVSCHSSLSRRGMEWTTPKAPALKLQPLLPDKEMHRVLRMASGRLNGKVGSGELLHVLKGIVKKDATTEIEKVGDETIETTRETFKITFRIVDRFGNIRTVQS
ncbi:DUF6094 domain-containing protein (plasmid) [Paenibacillus urinalis]|uniref:DUF6094 domain-containing protein n=2 Tax=Paenibacillus TaxID=44249 RepID=A0AAX3N659_9BACL|nr:MULTISPECIES: DUF6094 domain-containing protein [Paenibacillus]MCM3130570.1 DUF6094 domain-containing protein [Paenibacillus sp. MER 78]WDH85256.1 DUF6094 domain-containing protein [Paenibacillus urinalis]WDH95104.1 DUF6094 domain-containing protein [Paenibacillus urinalis]WDI05423.1 DUF6094 domain-containing protein [Paenibacillus urinalis]